MISSIGNGVNKEGAQNLNLKQQFRSKPEADQTTWDAFYKGETEAINIIYQQHVDLMYNYGCQLTKDTELVRDCIQEVFLQLIKYQSKIKPVISGRAYLLKSLQREILRKKKKDNRYTLQEEFDESQSFAISLSTEMKLIENQLTEHKRKLLKATFDKLPTKQREAIMLYYYEGFTYEEISHIMGIKLVKSARKLIYKAISSIKSALQGEHIDLMLPLLIAAFLSLNL
ncbi:MAG: hypothetical protein CMO01_25475 [Thalassobius sp.]|nr:hypothetical protein [Thalassovita sp.]